MNCLRWIFARRKRDAVTESQMASSAPADFPETQTRRLIRSRRGLFFAIWTRSAAEYPATDEAVDEVVPTRNRHGGVWWCSQPDMDELVARVLANMSPDVLQRVRRRFGSRWIER